MKYRLGRTIRRLIPELSLLLLAACNQNIFLPTPTCSGGWGPYIGKDIPELTTSWVVAFKESGLEGRDIKVQGVGETWVWFCNGKSTESWGMAYTEIQATIIVDDIKDFESLGIIMEKVYRSIKSLIAKEEGLSESRLSILFVSKDDNKEALSRTCNFNQGISMMEEGVSGKELFEETCRD
jgi:hypothetical protein